MKEDNHFDPELNRGVDWLIVPVIVIPLLIICALVWFLVLS